MNKDIKVIPGILSLTLEDYEERLQALAGVTKFVHVDVADGLAVPTRALSLSEILSFQSEFKLILHLLVQNPHLLMEQLRSNQIKEGANVEEIIFHLDWEEKPYFIFDQAKELGIKVSVAISPVMEGVAGVNEVETYINLVSSVMVMGTVPGFSGQPFREEVLKTIVHLHKLHPDLPIAVDQGMNLKTVPLVVQAGASIIYATSFWQRHTNPAEALSQLKESVGCGSME